MITAFDFLRNGEYKSQELSLRHNANFFLVHAWKPHKPYNLDKNCIQIFEVSQPSIFKQIKKETGLKKYRKGIDLDSEFSCTLHKLIDGFTKYTFNIIDREENEDKDEEIKKEWEALKKDGFDIDQLVLGGDPFNPEGDS